MSDSTGSPSVQTDAIAVVGMAGQFPGARNLEQFWDNLVQGVGSISVLNDDQLREAGVSERELRDPNYVKVAPLLEDVGWLDASLFGISPREAEILDPQIRCFLETCHSALQSAACDPSKFDGRIGLYGGARKSEYLERNLHANSAIMRAVGGLATESSNYTDYVSTVVAFRLNLRGPVISTVTACSTSLVAVHLASTALHNNECDVALAGAVEIPLPIPRGYFYSEGGLFAPDGQVRPFDAQARGTVFGAGCGAVVLKRLSDALVDNDNIQALIIGSAINNDGAGKSAFTAPSEDGQADVVESALKRSAIEPDTVGFVEAHGTGTTIGDPIEVAALSRVYGKSGARQRPCALASVKGNVGHLGAAAGICGFIKTILSIREGQLPASLNYSEPNPRIDFESGPFAVNSDLRQWPDEPGPRRAGVSAFGVGGTNAHLIVEQSPQRQLCERSKQRYQLLTISAHTTTALGKVATDLGEHLATTEADAADVAYTLNVGRADLAARQTFVVKDSAEAAVRLVRADNATTVHTIPKNADRAVAFMFPGQGAQYVGMARGLYQTEPTFAACLDWCANILQDSHGIDLKGLLFPARIDDAATRALDQTAITQPALFAVEYALAQALVAKGVVPPAAMVGHSVGEYVAACLAGVLEAEQALRLVADRGALLQKLPGGAMLAVLLPEEMLRPILPPELDLAAVNARGVCVVSGRHEDVQRMKESLAVQGTVGRLLRTSHAFHSHMLDPVLDEFFERVSALTLSPPKIPYLSNVTGTWVTAEDVTTPEYWVRQLRGCVRFADSLNKLMAKGGKYIFAEVGPGHSLTNLARSHPAGKSNGTAPITVSLMRQPDDAHDNADDGRTLLDAVGQIWAAGGPVNWERFWSDEKRRRLSLPAYPYERQRFWIEPEPRDVEPVGDDDTGPFYVPVWREMPLPSVSPAATDTVLSATPGPTTMWVVVGHRRNQLVRSLVSLLRDASASVLVVSDDQDFDYRNVFGEVTAAEPEKVCIVHTLAFGKQRAGSAERARARQLLDDGFYSVLNLLQESARTLSGVDAALFVVTSDMQDVLGDGRIEPAKSSLLGLVKLVPKEFESVTARSIDFSSTESPDVVAHQLLAEMIPGIDEQQIAYRGRKRWTRSYSSVDFEIKKGFSGVLKEHGVYIISGGLGGLGRELALQLAKLGGVRLVLIGRRGLPDRADWPAVLAATDQDSVTKHGIRTVYEIEAAGGKVLVCKGDVTDERRMREIDAEIVGAFGQVDGIFHLAGIPGGGLLEARTRDACAQVLAPKVAGTYTLDSVFRPELFVLYSSVASIIGDLGQGDYSGANAVMDAFAQQQWAKGRKVLSINWPPWSDTGMAYETHGPTVLVDLALGATNATPVAHPLLRSRRDSGSTTSDFVAFEVTMTPESWVLDEHRMNGLPSIPASGIIEIAQACYKETTGSPLCEIRELTFMRPLVAEQGIDVRAELYRTNTGSFNFAVWGRAEGREKIEYARARIAPVGDNTPRQHDLEAVREVCTRETRHACVPPQALQFGPRWDTIVSRLSGENLDLVTIELAKQFASDLEEFSIHPAMLDNACGLGMTLPPGGEYLPLSYQRVVIRKPLTRRCYSIIRYPDKMDGDIVQADMSIVDAAGSELVAIEGYSVINMSAGGISSSTRQPVPADAVEETGILDSTPLSRAIPSELERDIEFMYGRLDEHDASISPADGVDALATILACHSGPQVIVCPGGLAERERRSGRVTRASLTQQPMSGVAAVTPRNLTNPYVAPESSTEQALADLWRDAIGIDLIGVEDDFRELGGNSLVAVQLVSRISEHFRTRVSVAEMFQASTIRALASKIDELEVLSTR